MTDYLSEQKDELEVLKSIYPEELTIINEDPMTFELYQTIEELAPNAEYDSDDEEEMIASVVLRVEYTETYPDSLPNLTIKTSNACDLNEEDIDSLHEELKTLGEENLGMAMVFTLASQLKESIIERIKQRAVKREKEAEERLMASLKAEESKFIGTKVTPEIFLAWKLKFDEEMEALEASSDSKSSFKKSDKKKLTGRQLFEKDSKLAQSDMQFLEEGDEDVDTTMFERLGLNQRDDAGEEEEGTSVLDILRENQD